MISFVECIHIKKQNLRVVSREMVLYISYISCVSVHSYLITSTTFDFLWSQGEEFLLTGLRVSSLVTHSLYPTQFISTFFVVFVGTTSIPYLPSFCHSRHGTPSSWNPFIRLYSLFFYLRSELTNFSLTNRGIVSTIKKIFYV